MSRTNDAHDKAQEFLHLGNEIARLEERRAKIREELSGMLQPGDTVLYKGQIHEWESYERTSTGWKALYTEAYQLADDEAQVILGEKEAKATKKSGPFFRFVTKKP